MGTRSLTPQRGVLRPYFIDSIVCLKFIYLVINSTDEVYNMSFLTLSGLKKALQYIQDNSRTIKYHPFEPLKGMIVIPKNIPDDEQYHLFLIQKFEPRLIDKFSNELTLLSINGQEFLDILSDDKYIEILKHQIRKLGYSEPSDRQIYKLLRQQMGDYSTPVTNPVSEIIALMGSLTPEIDITPKWSVEQESEIELPSPPPEEPATIETPKKKKG
jgi:hypothetical protein